MKIVTKTAFDRGSSLGGRDGSFRYAQGIDTRWPDGFLRSGSAGDTETISLTGTIKYIIQSSNGYHYGFSSDGKIYERGVGGPASWTLAYTDAGGEIYGAAEWEGYIYWVTQTKIRRVQVSSISFGVAWTTTADFVTTNIQHNTSGATYHTMVPALGYMMVANGRYLGVIDTSHTWNYQALSLPAGFLISSIVEVGDTVALGIYNNPSTLVNGPGWVYQWDGKSPTWNRRVQIPAQGVNAMCFTDALIIQAGQLGHLFTTDFTTVTPLGTYYSRAFNNLASLKPYQMVTWRGMALMLGTGGSAGNHLFTYGRMTDKKPYALGGEMILEASPDQSLTLGTVFPLSDYYVLASYSFFVDFISYPGQTPTGFVNSHPLTGAEGDEGRRKIFHWIRVSFAPLTGGSLSMYTRANPEGSFSTQAKLGDGATSFSQTGGTEAIFLIGAEATQLEYQLRLTSFGQQAIQAISYAYTPLIT